MMSLFKRKTETTETLDDRAGSELPTAAQQREAWAMYSDITCALFLDGAERSDWSKLTANDSVLRDYVNTTVTGGQG